LLRSLNGLAVGLVKPFEHQFDFGEFGFDVVEVQRLVVLIARIAHDVNSVGGFDYDVVHR